VTEHLSTTYHKKAAQVYHIQTLTSSQALQATAIGRSIIKGNELLANRIGSLLILVYNDAKKLTLSGNSFPGRAVAGMLAASFKFCDGEQFRNISDGDLQYLSPNGHRGTDIGRLVFLREQEYSQYWQREFTKAERSNVWAMVSMAATVRRDEDCEISEWGSLFQAEARYESFNVTARDRILQILHAVRTWAIEDDLFYETRSPCVTWADSPASTRNDNEGMRFEPRRESTASAAASAPPPDNARDELFSVIGSKYLTGLLNHVPYPCTAMAVLIELR